MRRSLMKRREFFKAAAICGAASTLPAALAQEKPEAIKALDLQGSFSMSTGNVPTAFSLCDQLIVVSRHEERRGNRIHIRNVPVSIVRDSDEGREWMKEHA